MTRETLVFRAATGIALVHALDDAVVNRQPGVPLEQHALAAAIALGAGLAAAASFPRLWPGVRAAIALAFGVLALVNGGMHVAHIVVDGAARSDFTGVATVAAAAVLLALAVVIPFRHRGEHAATRRRRWANRAVATAALALLAYVLLLPVASAIPQVHKHREPIASPPSRAYEPVSLRASDGIELRGWYVRSQNGGAVLLVHGGGGDRTGALRHAELLRRHGYGVLLYDSRGRGESEGNHNRLGWGWEKDVAGALAFLRARPDVDPARIGGLGLSTGANVLIEVAARRKDLRAVVSDGATARSFADDWNLLGADPTTPVIWTMTAAVRVLSGSAPGEPLEELVPKVSPTPLLLIASGLFQNEAEFNRLYAAAAREPVELWELADVHHTAGVRELPREYERRVVGLFDRALLRR